MECIELSNGMKIPYKEIWVTDNELSEIKKKSKRVIQAQLRQMYQDDRYRKFIDKEGKRTVKLSQYDKWRLEVNNRI